MTSGSDASHLRRSEPVELRPALICALRVAEYVGWTAIAIVALAVAVGRGPALLGLQSLIVYSGSMEPAILTGSVLINQPADPALLAPGDIVTYRAPDGGDVLITHRIVAVVEPGADRVFRTKGDVNRSEDSQVVPARLIVGRHLSSVPFAGYVLHVGAGTAAGRLGVLGIALAVMAVHTLRQRVERAIVRPE